MFVCLFVCLFSKSRLVSCTSSLAVEKRVPEISEWTGKLTFSIVCRCLLVKRDHLSAFRSSRHIRGRQVSNGLALGETSVVRHEAEFQGQGMGWDGGVKRVIRGLLDRTEVPGGHFPFAFCVSLLQHDGRR